MYMNTNIKIVPVREHFEVHIDGEFYCSADTFPEAKQDVEHYLDAQKGNEIY